jgi:hypothetical protein
VAAAGPPRPITLVLDNARYQRCELVQSLARQGQRALWVSWVDLRPG